MKESKISYLALTCSVGAVLLCGVSSMLSVFPNSSKIDALSHQVRLLSDENTRLAAAVADGGENRIRINELDVGMTALANVMKIDRTELAKAIAAAKAGQDTDASVVQMPHNTEQPATSRTAPAQSENAPATAKPLHQQMPVPASAQANSVLGEGRAQITTAKQANSRDTRAVPFVTPADQNSGSEPLLGADNPFVAPSDTTSAGGEVPATVEVPASKPDPLTIAQVDSVLGKRLSANWYKPAGAPDDLSTIIQLKMNRDGKVATVRLSKSSGNSAFDNSAINAVKSIGAIDEVRQLSDADFQKAYASRSIQFTPQMGG